VPDDPAAGRSLVSLASWQPQLVYSSSEHKPRNPMQASSKWWILLPQKARHMFIHLSRKEGRKGQCTS
jgi:hypothetical protein